MDAMFMWWCAILVKSDVFVLIIHENKSFDYIGDTHNARTLIPMNTQILPLGASSKTGVTTPSEIIPYYRLDRSIWSLSDNKESSRWVLSG
jgi:hypothetical protein